MNRSLSHDRPSDSHDRLSDRLLITYRLYIFGSLSLQLLQVLIRQTCFAPDKRAANAECHGAGLLKLPDIVQVDAAGWHEGDKRERAPEVPEIRDAHRSGKDLDYIGAIPPGRQDLGGCKGAGNADHSHLPGLLD